MTPGPMLPATGLLGSAPTVALVLPATALLQPPLTRSPISGRVTPELDQAGSALLVPDGLDCRQ